MNIKMVKIIAWLILNALFLNSFGEDEVPLIRVQQGLVRGIQEESLNGRKFYSYMSIPYAESPVGNLRFKDPIPPKPWDSVLDGTLMSVECLQIPLSALRSKNLSTIKILGREDCLYLNVFTSAPNEQERKLPVMVYIHGGGFILGGANQFPPHFLMNKDIVLVTIQYRLGIFGFLSTEDSVIPGNMGLKDQQLALKWVKENIEAFGGDLNRITLFGQSAGAASVNYQILSPGSKGLFNRAIMQSGTSLCPFASNKNHRRFAIEKGHEFNCSFDLGSEDFMKCMQKVNPYYLVLSASMAKVHGLDQVYVLPRVDGEFINEAPEILMKKGKYNKVDIIAGINRDEGTYNIFLDYLQTEKKEKLKQNFAKFGPINLDFKDEKSPLELTEQAYKFYLQRKDFTINEGDKKKIIELKGDRYFLVCYDTVANFLASDNDINFYAYRLDHFGELSTFHAPGFNRTNLIGHSEDLPYLFPGSIQFGGRFLQDEKDLKLGEILSNLWTNFAETGNPTPSGSDFIWREATEDNFVHLSLTTSPEMKDDYFQKQRKFWSSLNTAQNMNIRKTNREEL